MKIIQNLLKKLERWREQSRDLRKVQKLKEWLNKYTRSVSMKTIIRDEEIWLVDVDSKTAKTDTGRIIHMNPEIWNKYKQKDKIVKYEIQTGYGITRSGKKVSLVVNPEKIPDFIVSPSGKVHNMRQQSRPSYKILMQCLEALDEPIETPDSDYSEAENFQQHGRMPVLDLSEPIECTTVLGENILVGKDGWYYDKGLISSEGASGLGKMAWAITNGLKWIYRRGAWVIHTAGYYIERPLGE